MASMTTAISVQVDKRDKEKATEILQRLGVTMSGLINMTIKQVIIHGGIPFSVREQKLSKDTIEAFEEIEEMKNNPTKYPRYKNRKDLEEALLSDD